MEITTERYEEIREKLNGFENRLGWGIPHWWFMEIGSQSGQIDHGNGPAQGDETEEKIQKAITSFLEETGISAQEIYHWAHVAQSHFDTERQAVFDEDREGDWDELCEVSGDEFIDEFEGRD